VSAVYRRPASALDIPGELQIHPPRDSWATLTSNAFFGKPTTLLEHRRLATLRGIVSHRWSSLKPGQTFSEAKRLEEACTSIPKNYRTAKTHTQVEAKVIATALPYCRIQARDSDGVIVDQILYVSKSREKAGMIVTYTLTFFYPQAEAAKAKAEVTRFLSAVSRRANG